MNFGLTETGFSLKRQPDILADLNAALAAQFGSDLNLAADSAMGQMSGVFSQAAAEIWELAAAAWHSQYRPSAEGTNLDDLGKLVNLVRNPGTPTTVNARVFGSATDSVSGTTRALEPQNSATFTAASTVTLATDSGVRVIVIAPTSGEITAASVTYRLQVDLIGVNGFSLMSTFTENLSDPDFTQAVAASLVGTLADTNPDWAPLEYSDNGDGSFLLFLTDGGSNLSASSPGGKLAFQGSALQSFACDAVGAVHCPALALSALQDPPDGLYAILNAEDGVSGTDPETDAEFRERMRFQPRNNARCTMESIRQSLLAVDGVTTASVVSFEDTLSSEDPLAEGTFEVFVDGTDDDATDVAVANAIWRAKPSGIQPATLAENSGDARYAAATDAGGVSRYLVFSRPTLIDLHITLQVADPPMGAPLPPDNWAAMIAANVLALGQGYGLGQDIPVQRFYAAAFAVPNITAVELTVSRSPHGSGDATFYDDIVPIAASEKPYFDPSLINVRGS